MDEPDGSSELQEAAEPLGEPTDEEYGSGVERLLGEVDAAMSSDRWAVTTDPNDVDESARRIFDGASLRHCCRLLSEIEQAAQTGQELAVRLLGRAHIEAWFCGLYIHFGGNAAIGRIAEDTQFDLEATNRDLQQFDALLAAKKKDARKRVRKVEETNQGITRWNDEHPDEPQKPLLKPPHVPRLDRTSVDLSDRVKERAAVTEPRRLPLTAVVDALTEMAPERDFGLESFTPVYHLYRFLSAAAPHPTIDLYDDYLVYDDGFTLGDVVRIGPTLNFSFIKQVRFLSLYTTAFLAEYVISAAGDATPVATGLRLRLSPTPEGRAPWAAGADAGDESSTT